MGSARMLAGADAAIVVLGDEDLSDVWVEDCSIVMAHMHLMADSLGLGSCWIQGRNRDARPGQLTTENYIRSFLKFPSNYRLLAMLSLGIPAVRPEARQVEDLPFDKVHINRF
jgi:nitroreductase